MTNKRMDKTYYVYITASRTKVLYTGVTSDLTGRIIQHKDKRLNGFTKKYNVSRLVWYNETNDIQTALEWEKKIKGWSRKKKIDMIEKNNPQWQDLSAAWLGS